MEVLYAELNKRAEAATSSYSVTGDSLNYIYSVLVTKNHQNIQSRCSFYVVVSTYFDYEKMCRTIHTAIVSHLLKGTPIGIICKYDCCYGRVC